MADDETVVNAVESVTDLTKQEKSPQDAVPENATPVPPPPVPPVPVLPSYPPVPPPPPGYPPVPPPPYGYSPVSPTGPRSRKGLYLSLAVAAWLVIAAGTAGTVVAVGSGNSSTVADSVPVPVPTPSASASPTATPSSFAPAPTASVAPSPTSTVKGSVSGNTHSGDLRFFLLPVPSDAAAYGDQDGDKLSVGDLAKELGNPSTSKGILNSYGCSGGATRTYRTNDGNYTVQTQLIHFGGAGYARDWVSGLSFSKATSFSVSGVGDAKGYAFNPTADGGEGSLIGISHVGDVEYEITVTGTGKLSHALLTPLMQRLEQRLTSGH